jgi:hypothetical protein
MQRYFPIVLSFWDSLIFRLSSSVLGHHVRSHIINTVYKKQKAISGQALCATGSPGRSALESRMDKLADQDRPIRRAIT